MTLRTPRRRISPKTKRRYKAIKGFFKRALGSPSQPDLLQITSSIAVNVTNLNHKILGIEKKLNDVNKHCCDCNSHDNTSIQSKSRVSCESRNRISQQDILLKTQSKKVETNVLNTKSENLSKKNSFGYEHGTNNESNKVDSTKIMNYFPDEEMIKLKKKISKIDDRAITMDNNFSKHKTKSVSDDFVPAYSTSSFHSLDQFKKFMHSKPKHSGFCHDKRYTKVPNDHFKDKPNKEHLKNKNLEGHDYNREAGTEKHTKNRKPKYESKNLDQDFIADIIRRQYKPVKMFSRKQSDLSQFSEPVCRDRDFGQTANYCFPEYFQPSPCSCRGHHNIRYTRYSDCSDMKSVCDNRLFNVKKNSRTKHHRKFADAYSNSEIYDLVPVKEKTSPKSRRKFFEENLRRFYYKEVPPSPRSQRPRLNLKAQNAESEYTIDTAMNPFKRVSTKRAMRHQTTEEFDVNYYLSDNSNKKVPTKKGMLRHIATENEEFNFGSTNNNKIFLPKRSMRYEDTEGSFYPSEMRKKEKQNLIKHENQTELPTAFDTGENTATVETPFNKTQDTVSSDNTDKALSEIKDILQNFLLEIKKVASTHSAKSEFGNKLTDNRNVPPSDERNVPNNGLSFNNYTPAQCPVVPSPYMPTLPAYGNTCCYPIMTMCPLNCMQNSYVVPSTSFTCNNCDGLNETSHNKNINKNGARNDTLHCETDELIKEIYKLVTCSPTECKDHKCKERNNAKKNYNGSKVLTSRSVGGSTRVCRHDAKVGTAKMNCVSKSCEAISKKLLSEMYTSDTNASYSDTVLEKLSLEPTATQSISVTESSTELSEADKTKRSKFLKFMKTLGFSKKNKKDVIEELSESESIIDIEVKKPPPFRQNITNYAMYDQEYCRPPPMSPHYHPEYPQDYRPPYNLETVNQDPRMQQPVNNESPHLRYHYPHPRECPTARPYSQSYESYNLMQPQIPLCLKEVEVKSTGCQSERKMSFFRKIAQKIQPVDTMRDNIQNIQHGSTQTPTAQNSPGLFNWKNAKTKNMDSHLNPLAYSYKTQKKLAEGDTKIRNVMLKKMLYKRNPFSPRNLIIRTLLGKDKSSFGEPPKMYRPRLFI